GLRQELFLPSMVIFCRFTTPSGISRKQIFAKKHFATPKRTPKHQKQAHETGRPKTPPPKPRTAQCLRMFWAKARTALFPFVVEFFRN
ncbi:MAG: hypothetical protein RR434_04680, partial [Raoultibacter sp.]